MEKDAIWGDVCRNLDTEDYLGDDYCILHNPNPKKDPKEFTDIIEARLKSNHCYYQAVVFPVPFETNHVDFKLPLNFFHAVFYSYIDILDGQITNIYLDYATFHGSVRFYHLNFSQSATFTFSHFKNNASFMGSWFERSDFNHAVFDHKAEFNSWAKFRDDVNFSNVKFQGEVDFNSCTFEKAVRFENSEFSDAHVTSFKRSEFQSDVIFDGAAINCYFDFEGDSSRRVFVKNASMSMRNTRVNKPEHLTFHTVDLRPNWFVNVDSRKFVFTDVKWINIDWWREKGFWNNFRNLVHSTLLGLRRFSTGKGEEANENIAEELKSLENRGFDLQRKRLLAIACRQLAVNAEDNNQYDDASKFRFMAMETRRLDHGGWRRVLNLYWIYKWTSGYGESWRRAALVLFGVWFLFGIFYWQLGSFNSEHLFDLPQSLGYSSLVMLLQKPEPRPASNFTFTLYILETIFAPLQVALLALAIRRKFMR
ncbi:MAG: pentapeptide repeat-containing protein [Acidobacteria bacterium]|nr:pentapeptide repeat-containing protein [Acidobacteriota bacterium]